MFTGSTIVLTGVGGRGQVGEAVARAFGSAGASLVLVDRTASKVEARAKELAQGGANARGYGCDLTDPNAVARLVDAVRANHGDAVHAFVHMAGGFGMSGPVGESSVDVFNQQIAINLTTAYVAARGFLPLVRAARGAMVFFASHAVLPGHSVAQMSAYAIAKSGVVTLVRAMAEEERDNGVRVNAVAPTSVRTAANVDAMGDNGRYVEREQVADTVLFLCSPGAGAISGTVVPLA